MNKEKVIKKLKEVMKSFFPEAETYLYGSFARNEAKSDSDMDLLILLPDQNHKSFQNRKYEVYDKVFDIEFEEGVNLSPLVILKSVWNFKITPFTINVNRDAILL